MEGTVDKIKHSHSLGFGAYMDSELINQLNEAQSLSESQTSDFDEVSSTDVLNELQY